MTTRQRLGCFSITALAAIVTACHSGDDPSTDAGPPPTSLGCPLPGPLPFEVDADWHLAGNGDLVATQPRLKHQPVDLLGNPAHGYAQTDFAAGAALITGNEELHGIMARVEWDRGLFADPVPEEKVSLWEYADGVWASLGQTTSASWATASAGSYAFSLAAPPASGLTVRYAVLEPEPSCGAHYTFELPSQRQVVITDIDGTLTLSDDELYAEISDGTYDQVEMSGGALLMQTWASKGYQVIYLTARPHMFRTETRAWLDAHEYPAGPVITANELVFGDDARSYKAVWIDRLIGELEWRVTAAYGNATSDIDAYADAGIAKEVTFIVGENAGVDGTVAIENNDFHGHITDYVLVQPDADAW